MILNKCWRAAALGVSLGLPEPSLGESLHVPADYSTIQSCIDAAVGSVDECVVAPGTYHETINFLGKAITLRSSGGRDVTTIDATGIGGSVVTCASGEGPDTVLDGFTITGGTGTDLGDGSRYGGGILDFGSSPTVTNCTFIANTAGYYYGGGGGMYNYYSNPRVTNSTFDRNAASYGGGMNSNSSNPMVINCTFSGNSAAVWGGGMYNSDSIPTVTTCTFSGNSASVGGGMINFGSSPTLTNCTFSRNMASGGGGIYNGRSSPTVTDCTFSENKAISGGGIFNDHSNPKVTNCVLWGDSPQEMVSRYSSTPTIRFSNLQGGLPVGTIDGGGNIDLDPMFVRPPDPGPDGTWNGVDDDYGDLRLQAGSPCIDAGDPAFVPQPGETDLEGHARVLCERVDMGAFEFGIGDYDCNQSVNLTDFAAWPDCMTGPSAAELRMANSEYRMMHPFDSLSVAPRLSTIDPSCASFDFNADGDIDLADFSEMQRLIVVP